MGFNVVSGVPVAEPGSGYTELSKLHLNELPQQGIFILLYRVVPRRTYDSPDWPNSQPVATDCWNHSVFDVIARISTTWMITGLLKRPDTFIWHIVNAILNH